MVDDTERFCELISPNNSKNYNHLGLFAMFDIELFIAKFKKLIPEKKHDVLHAFQYRMNTNRLAGTKGEIQWFNEWLQAMKTHFSDKTHEGYIILDFVKNIETEFQKSREYSVYIKKA